MSAEGTYRAHLTGETDGHFAARDHGLDNNNRCGTRADNAREPA
jgi:hypothetical protein